MAFAFVAVVLLLLLLFVAWVFLANFSASLCGCVTAITFRVGYAAFPFVEQAIKTNWNREEETK